MHTETAIELKDSFLRGDRTAESIVRYFLDRIEALDGRIGAFLAVFPERALEQARSLDQRKAAGEKLGKLAGIPIAIKDNIHIEGELTTCASKFLTNFRAPFSATVTRLIEEEDGIIIGKTNLDEFAMGSSTEHSALKQTRNPWNLDCTPGGSSGGSAAAVAARMVPLSLGSDTGGSVRQPAALCGVVGYKPTYGRISRYGLVAFGSSLDQIGPFAATTSDAALLMEVLGQPCVHDSTSLPDSKEEYLAQLNASLQGIRIGVPRSLLEKLDQEAKANFDASLELLKKQGAELIDVDLSVLAKGISVYYILATAEASTNLARFDGVRYGIRSERAKTLGELYDFSKEEGYGREVKRRILLGTFVLSSGYQDAYYRQAQRVRTLIIRQYEQAFTQCDIIASPVAPRGAFQCGSIKDPLQEYLEDIFTIPANLAGIPAISVPAGLTSDGKPLGLQLAGPQRADVSVFRIAHAFEQAHSPTPALPELAE